MFSPGDSIPPPPTLPAEKDQSVESELNKVRSLIESHHRFLLTTHINPDGDGLGCEIALAAYLQQKGKHADIINHSATPWNYQFLDPDQRILQFDSRQHTSIVSQAEVIFVLDTNTPHRLESMEEFILTSPAKKVCIDHHLDTTEFADMYLIDDSCAATGEIVFRLIDYLDSKSFTREIAHALYVAIMTDTGSFRFPKTDSGLHRMVARLIEEGADPVEAYHQVYEQSSPHRLRLLGKSLSTLETLQENKIAYLTIDQEMFRETGADEEDIDNFVTYPLSIQGVQIGLLFTELNNGVKISFRSKGEIPINKLAQEFGGNGHKNAAGARVLNARLSEIVDQVLDRAQHYLQQ